MEKKQVVFGDVMRCTSYEEHITCNADTSINGVSIIEESEGFSSYDADLEEKDAILIKIADGSYLPLKDVKNNLMYMKLYLSNLIGFSLGDIVLIGTPFNTGDRFVKTSSYYPKSVFSEDQSDKRIRFSNLKKHLDKR